MKLFHLIKFFSLQKLALRLGALGMAIVLWLFVMSDKEYSIIMKMPLVARNISAQKALKEEVPEFAQVRLIGTGNELLKAYLLKNFFENFKLILDLDHISEEYDFILNDYFSKYPQKVVIPPSFHLKFVEIVYPREVHISLDEYLVKSVPITPQIIVQPIPGYIQVGDIKMIPPSVNVAGPNMLTKEISEVLTATDTLKNIEHFTNRTISLNKSNRLIEYSLNEINYQVDIQEISERIISEVQIQVVNVPDEFRVFVNPQTVSLTIFGGVNRIAEIYPEDIFIYIDFEKQWAPRSQFFEPVVVTPNDILEWKNLSPRNVELVVTKGTS